MSAQVSPINARNGNNQGIEIINTDTADPTGNNHEDTDEEPTPDSDEPSIPHQSKRRSGARKPHSDSQDTNAMASSIDSRDPNAPPYSTPTHDEKKPLLLAPRHDEENLKDQFFHFVRVNSQHPIERLEMTLYECHRIFSQDLKSQINPLRAIDEVHSLMQMTGRVPNYDAVGQFSGHFVDCEKALGRSMAQYRLIEKCLFIINGLMCKWGVLDIYDYRYRWSGAIANIKMVNLAAMVPTAIQCETIFYSMEVFESPLDSIVEEQAKQHAKLLHIAFTDAIGKLLHLGKDIHFDFETHPSIDGYLAGKNKKLAHKYVIKPNKNLVEFNYQQLKNPGGLFLRNIGWKDHDNLSELKQSLVNLDEAFRSFEKIFLGNVLYYSTRNHKATRAPRTGTIVFRRQEVD